jgi:hypothetical protein
MESNNNYNYNDNNEQEEQRLRKRKFNELANDGQPAAEEGEQNQPPAPEKLSKKDCGGPKGNDVFEVFHSRPKIIGLLF